MFTNAIILAGGEGTRMRPLTNYIPKGLVEVNGEPLIKGIIKVLKSVNIDDIYLTYGHLSEVLFKELKNDVKGFINTTKKDNSYFLFNSFVKNINDGVVVLPCDLVLDVDLNRVYLDYISLGEPAIMLVGTTPQSNIDGDYIVFDKNNIITTLDRNIKSEIYCSGIQIINPYKVNQLCKINENFYEVWKQLLGTNNLKVSNERPIKWMAFDKINQII